MIRTYLVTTFIWECIKIGAKPWNFSQVNSRYFNDEKQIFSKLEIEKHIPKKWKLDTYVLDRKKMQHWESDILKKFTFPVFLKPEWSQNSYGIFRADNAESLDKYLKIIREKEILYFAQAAAGGTEVDVFFTRNFETFSITQMHDVHGEKYPIQGIHNGTQNMDITQDFSLEDIEKIRGFFDEISDFSMARVGVKTNSLKDFCAGKFKIIEINLFLPFPLSLLDRNLTWGQRRKFLKNFVKNLAKIVKTVEPKSMKNIFWPMTRRHFMIKG